MHRVTLTSPDDFDGWRDAARRLSNHDVDPAEVTWQVGEDGGDLFSDAPLPPERPGARFSVPRAFVDMAQSAILHRDPERFALLYALSKRCVSCFACNISHCVAIKLSMLIACISLFLCT